MLLSNTLRADGPPVPDRGLSVEAVATNCVLRPVDGLPALNDADLTVHIVGRNAQIAIGKATANMSAGRKLVLSSGLFEVPDTAPHEPPARVRFKLDGPVPAAAELLAMDRLRDVSQTPFDPATTRGNVSAQVSLAMPLKPDLPPGSTNYSIAVDATNFSADHMIMGQRLMPPVLHVMANTARLPVQGRRQDRAARRPISNITRPAATRRPTSHIRHARRDDAQQSRPRSDERDQRRPCRSTSAGASRPPPTAKGASPSRPI